MKIVVTGAVGHIGSYLIRNFAVVFPGSEIVMIDNMLTQRFPSLFDLPALGKYRFIEGDIIKLDLVSILEKASVVVHLAAITDAAGSFGNPEQVEENNFMCTKHIAEACLRTRTRLVMLSSTSVYGTQSDIVSETCLQTELNPQSPYAITKLKEENIVLDLCEQEHLQAIVCRFGTIFGASPGMRFHTAVNKFCWQAAMGKPITVWSTALDQKRPYLDLIDAGRAISFIIDENIFDGRIYNVLSHNITVRQVVDTIREFIPNIEIKLVDSEIMNQLSYEVSCERFKGLGFTFSGDLRRGIGETISLLQQSNN